MNKIFKTFIVALAITATQAFAGVMTQTPIPTPIQEPEYFNGFYIGLGSGLVKPNAKVEYDYLADVTVSDAPFAEVSKNFKSNDSGKFGIGGNIFAGFGKVFNSKYLGIELFGNLYDPDMKNASKIDLIIPPANLDIIFKTKIKNDYSYGIFVRGGYLISPKTMFYILFGIDQSKFEVESSINIISGIDTILGTSGIDDILTTIDKFHKTRIGYLPGIGIETALNDQFTLRMQYIYAFYSSFKHTIQSTTTVTPATINKTYTTKVDPSRGMLSLMLSWYIA